MTNALRVMAVGLAAWCLLSSATFSGKDTADRVLLFPRLVTGQAVTYDVSYRAVTTTNSESPVAAPMAPPGGQIEAHLLLRVEALNVGQDPAKPSAQFRTLLYDPNAALPAAASSSQKTSGAGGKAVEFTLLGNGQVAGATGLEALSSDETAAWQQWVARFGVGAALPERGLKPGAKWRTEEPITSALLTGLSWDKESQYVDDEPCGVVDAGKNGDAAAANVGDRCAVILTTALLKQKSPQKEATPDDYKLHDLRTYGVAKGKNEVISHISVKTGIVVRATEDANQSLNVIVAKSDGSNRVHYVIDAQSHSQIRLTDSSPAR